MRWSNPSSSKNRCDLRLRYDEFIYILLLHKVLGSIENASRSSGKTRKVMEAKSRRTRFSMPSLVPNQNHSVFAYLCHRPAWSSQPRTENARQPATFFPRRFYLGMEKRNTLSCDARSSRVQRWSLQLIGSPLEHRCPARRLAVAPPEWEEDRKRMLLWLAIEKLILSSGIRTN